MSGILLALFVCLWLGLLVGLILFTKYVAFVVYIPKWKDFVKRHELPQDYFNYKKWWTEWPVNDKYKNQETWDVKQEHKRSKSEG